MGRRDPADPVRRWKAPASCSVLRSGRQRGDLTWLTEPTPLSRHTDLHWDTPRHTRTTVNTITESAHPILQHCHANNFTSLLHTPHSAVLRTGIICSDLVKWSLSLLSADISPAVFFLFLYFCHCWLLLLRPGWRDRKCPGRRWEQSQSQHASEALRLQLIWIIISVPSCSNYIERSDVMLLFQCSTQKYI